MLNRNKHFLDCRFEDEKLSCARRNRLISFRVAERGGRCLFSTQGSNSNS